MSGVQLNCHNIFLFVETFFGGLFVSFFSPILNYLKRTAVDDTGFLETFSMKSPIFVLESPFTGEIPRL